MSEVVKLPDSNSAILVNLKCAWCEEQFNAILNHDCFCGPFDEARGKGTQVQYAQIICAKCGKAINVEIPYLDAEKESRLPLATINGNKIKFKDIPVYMDYMTKCYKIEEGEMNDGE